MKANRLLKLRDDNKAFAQTMGAMVALLVAIIVGVMVFYEVNGNIDFTAGDAGSNLGGTESTRAAWNNTNSTASTVFTLLPIVAIVLIASIILAVVTGFGGTGGFGGGM